MLIMQQKDTFIRQFGDLGYITSQLTKKDRVYDQVGVQFLSTLSRSPKEFEEITEELLHQFVGVDREELKMDLYEFIKDLEADQFVATGENLEELKANEIGFAYNDRHPKTIPIHILSQDSDPLMKPSSDLMSEYFREHPTIFGVHYEVTSHCNERCIHCYQIRRGVRHADMALVTDVMDQLREMGTTSLTLSGGEPLMHPEFTRILQLARSHDFVINILSNGTLLTSELLEAISETNINMIQISLYSMDPGIHDAITQITGSHTKTLKNIESLIELDIPVQISCPIMKQNGLSYEGVSKWCCEHKVRVLSDFVMMAKTNFDTSHLINRLDIHETREVIQQIIDVDSEYQLLLDAEPKTKDLEHYAKQPVCGVAVDNVCFTADGTLYPCSGFQGYVLGNVHDNTIREIWETSESILYLRSIRNDSFPKCLVCEARDYCIMCLVRNYNESNGDMFHIADHFCKVAFLNKELVELFRAKKMAGHENHLPM